MLYLYFALILVTILNLCSALKFRTYVSNNAHLFSSLQPSSLLRQLIYAKHAYFFMLVVSERVPSLKMRLLEKRIFENMFYKTPVFSRFIFLVCPDFRSSHSQMFFKILVLKNFEFAEKHLYLSLFLIKLLTSPFLNHFI